MNACVVIGTTHFYGAHTAEATQRRLQLARVEFGLYPVVSTEHVMTEGEMLADPDRAFEHESACDRLAITTDCAASMICAAEKHELFDWHPCICHLLNTAVKNALSNDTLTPFTEPVKALALLLRRSPTQWRLFRKIQKRRLREANVPDLSADDEQEDYSGVDSGDDGHLSDDTDAGLSVPADGEKAKPKRILRLGTWCETRWNSTFFLMKRAVLLERSIREFTSKAKKTDIIVPSAGWFAMKQVLPVMESIRELSERCEGDDYITISDVLYNVLKLLYDRMYMSDADAHEKSYQFDFITDFTMKLTQDLDNVNIIYCWALAAAMDGRRSSLHWLRRIWENRVDWPNVVGEYDTLASFKTMLKREVTALVSVLLILCPLQQ